MEVIIKGSPEEVAALVMKLQGRQEDVAKRFAEEMLIHRKNFVAGDIG
nr:hypothetical protein [uncultured Agathobaculum sp.]